MTKLMDKSIKVKDRRTKLPDRKKKLMKVKPFTLVNDSKY